MYALDNVGITTSAMVLAGDKGERLSPLKFHREVNEFVEHSQLAEERFRTRA